jgi:enoyl-CoA hydratase
MIKKYFIYNEEENIGHLEINRADKLNALSEDVLREFSEILDELGMKTLTGLIFSGVGEKAFIAGADIEAMRNMSSKEAQEFSDLGQLVTLKMERLSFPVLAAVNGFALGGGLEMALGCDFIYASSNAKFALPEASLGLVPGFGGTARLSKVVGRAKAKEMLYSGMMIDATQALQCGLALKVLDDKESLIKTCKDYLLKCSNNSPLAISMAKKILNSSADNSVENGLKTEQSVFGELFSSKDMKEGTAAFLEKRKPNFVGE